MLIVTYSEARKTFASILDRAKKEGSVLIKRSDGSMFRLSPEKTGTSPFDGIGTEIHLPPGALKEAMAETRNWQEHRFDPDMNVQ